MSRAIALGAVALLLGARAGAQNPVEYNYLKFKMLNTAQDPFPYWIDARSASPVGLVFSNVSEATHRSWKQWDDVTCAATAFANRGNIDDGVTDPRDPYDVYNVSTIWISSRSDPYYPYTLGNSDVTAITIPLTYAGVLRQCDIYLNGADYTWSTAATTPSGSVDVESLVLHEVGHCQGLDHTFLSSFDVMYATTPIGAQRRTLQARDTGALCYRYPASNALGAPCGDAGSCGGDAGLKCVTVPMTDGGAGSMCSLGCPTGQNFGCGIPYACQPSSAFAPQYDGACLPPGSFVTQVGKPCTQNSDCGSTNGLCQLPVPLPTTPWAAWVDGYCTHNCAPGQPACPADSACIDLGSLGLRCLKHCRVGMGDCRRGYTCVQPSNGGDGLCVPSCHGDLDCGAGSVCRVCDGTCLAQQNPAGQVGDPCSTADTCGAGQVCAKFTHSDSVSLCTQSCAQACASCPGGSTCHPIGTRGELYCLRDCSGPGTCPAGLQCGFLATGRACIPPCRGDYDCPVGLSCQFGQCQLPGDAGACPLCQSDAGEPVVVKPKDGGTGPGPGSGGCGCDAGGGSLAALLALLIPCANLLRRKRRA